MTEAQLFALAVTLAWLAGVRIYLTVFALGLAGAMGWVELPGSLELCASPWVIATAGVLTVVEFGADKIPGVDSAWDLLNTVLRIPGGAALAGAAAAPVDSEFGWAWAAAGGVVAALSHGLKSGTRAMINASPEPVSNWSASLGEDAVALAALALVFSHPWLALALLVGFALAVAGTVYLLLRWLLRRRPARPLS
ncbi:MAG TPA: DUF4126 domain-containing protein [Xanthomonadaceae bacterium]|nr:DUF4126 domain-containing protein [Xanthomonadaceae bacterium]